jgi:probable phosphoglycerate mutase
MCRPVPLIYLVRHGESEVNLTRTMSYKRVDPGLTPRGEAQAGALAAWFAGRNVARIYSSPLRRGVQTAEAIAAATGAPVEVTEALRELDVGSLEGRSDAAAWAIHDDVLRRWWNGEPAAAFPAGEDLLHVHARVAGFIESLAELHPSEDVVAVGHGGIFCAVLPRLCTIPWQPGTPLTLANTGVAVLRREELLTCELWNGVAHLS